MKTLQQLLVSTVIGLYGVKVSLEVSDNPV
jgi:hypothetical protein